MNNLPCNNCLIFPLCRNKDYNVLLDDCELISNKLYTSYDTRNKSSLRSSTFLLDILDLERLFRPTKWKTVETYDSLVLLISKEVN